MALTLGGAGGLGAPTLGDQLIASQGGSPPCSSLPHSARCSLAPLMSEFQVPLGWALSGQACRPRLQAVGASAAGTQVGLLLLVQTRLSWDLRSLHRSLFSEKATLLGGGQRAWGGALLWLPASSGGQDAWSAVPAVTAVATHLCWAVGLGERGFSQRLL